MKNWMSLTWRRKTRCWRKLLPTWLIGLFLNHKKIARWKTIYSDFLSQSLMSRFMSMALQLYYKGSLSRYFTPTILTIDIFELFFGWGHSPFLHCAYAPNLNSNSQPPRLLSKLKVLFRLSLTLKIVKSCLFLHLFVCYLNFTWKGDLRTSEF